MRQNQHREKNSQELMDNVGRKVVAKVKCLLHSFNQLYLSSWSIHTLHALDLSTSDATQKGREERLYFSRHLLIHNVYLYFTRLNRDDYIGLVYSIPSHSFLNYEKLHTSFLL